MSEFVLQRDTLIEFLNKFDSEKVRFISPDFGAQPLDEFRLNNPKSFIYPGIAEQVSVDISYGISLGGCLPILYGMSPFISARCFEQYKVLFGQTNLPICILPVGVGLGYDHNTLSHYSLDDIGLYSSIPGLKIFTPYDSKTATDYLKNWLNNPDQIVLRLERQPMPYDVLDLNINLEKNQIGVITKKNSNSLIISWGFLGIKILEKTKEENVDIFIIDQMTSTIPSDIIKKFETYENITITEESFINTGIAALLNSSLIGLNKKVSLRHINSSIYSLRAHRSTVWNKFNLDNFCFQ